MLSHIINLPQVNRWQDFSNPAYSYDLTPQADILQGTVHAYI
jgi:hypothetical protein